MWLERICARRREALSALRARRGEIQAAAAASTPRPGRFRDALAGGGLRIIAEIKRASPSRGMLAAELDVARHAAAYARGGAAALSVLTEPDFFRGSLQDLQAAAGAAGLPVLRKDFLLDPLQVDESAAAGADAVLLIAAALPGGLLSEMLQAARDRGLDALVEVHDAAEVERAADAGADLVGVNSRDLRSFTVDLKRALELAPRLAPDVIKVAESGVSSRQDAARMAAAGYHAVLVGEHLVRAADPAAAVAELLP